jgi:hypothetical protein
MLRLTAPLGLIALAATSAAAQEAPAPTPAEKNAIINAELPADQAAMKSHVMFLASDAMAGREAGSHEFDIAAQYVAAQFYAAGLRPAGDQGSYLQKVPLLSYKAADKGSMTLTRKGGQPIDLVFGEDYLPAANPANPKFSLTAPVVFVGYGIVGLGRNDYKGVDVKGKIVAFFGGSPKRLSRRGARAFLERRDQGRDRDEEGCGRLRHARIAGQGPRQLPLLRRARLVGPRPHHLGRSRWPRPCRGLGHAFARHAEHNGRGETVRRREDALGDDRQNRRDRWRDLQGDAAARDPRRFAQHHDHADHEL